MLKKLFFTAALSAVALWGAAQTTISGEKLWNFSNDPWVAGAYADGSTTDGLTCTGSKWTVDASNKTVDGVKYTQRLKSGGKGTISFSVTSGGTLLFLPMSASRDDATRTVTITRDNAQEGIHTITAISGNPVWIEQSISQAGAIALTTSGGINFYAIHWVPNAQGPNVVLSAPTSDGRIALDAAITATFSGEATDVTASYTSGGVSSDIVVEGSGTTYTLNFDKTYSTTYEVTVSGMVNGETVTATQSYTTIDEPVHLNIDPTTVTTTWPLPTQTGSSIIDNTLAIVDCYAVTDTYFSLKRIDQTGDKPGYMYFLLPAGAQGRLIINAMSDTRDVYYYTTTNTTILTANELSNIQGSGQATMMGQPTPTGSTLTAEISSDADAQTLVYIFCKRGQIDFQSVTWSLEPYYITSVSPANGTTVDAGSDITVTYNSEVNMPTITVNGQPVAVTTSDNLTFTVTGVTTDANTTYNVVVSATTAVAGGENVVGKEWSFMTSVPAEEKYLRIAGDEITLPADASTTIEVVVPYYSTVNYQDIESVRASIESYGYNVGTLTMADDVFNTLYDLVVDGTTYHLRMQRAAFMTSGELKLGDSTAYALYLMPTQPMEDGNETYAMTLVADVADETIMQQTPTFTGDFVYVNGSETVKIPAENIHVGNLKNKYFLSGYSYSEGEITFTYEGMDVKVLYLLNWTPGVGEWRVWTVEEIPAEMYIPNGDNSIVFRGVTIYGSAGTPKTPVRVTWFDINDPSNTFTLDGYGPFSKSLKMGGPVDDQANPQHRYLNLNATQGGELGSGAEVITMLVCNGSNTRESKFQMRGNSGIASQERLLPRGSAAWWSFRNSASTTIDMYGYDSGTNADPKGGNVQYIFLEAAPGKEFNPFEEADFNVKVDMNTVKVGEATRVLASTANRITVTVKTKLGDDAIISYRQSKLNFRKIGALTGDADMTASNIDVMTNAQGANVPLEDQYAVNVISESQSGPDADGYTAMTVVIESQVPLEGNTTYELWSSDATFVLNKETIGGIYTNPVSYAAPLYIIHTVQDQEFNYDFENAATADARLFPSNVYPAEYTTSVGVITSASTTVPFTQKNGSYILEVSGANNAMKVGFDTPADYPGAQSQTEGYKYIHFDMYVPTTNGATTPKVSLYTAEGELIPLVATDANWTYNDHLEESVPDKGSDVESVDLPADTWLENVRAASAVAGYWFPAFAATDRIYLSIEGANTAYVDNVTFVDANTNDFPTGIEELNNGKTIFYNGREVVNPTENRVEVYNIAGVMVMSQKGNADLSRLAKGIYIVRCGNEILKIRR